MELTDTQHEFLTDHHAAAMITIAPDGMPKAVRVGVALVDGRLWSSGTADRVRTGRLRRDPRCTLFVFDKAYAYLTIESTVTILDGPDAPRQNLELFRVMQNRPSGPLAWYGEDLDDEAFLARMSAEKRLVYEFAPQKAYGLG
ncbi:MAG TPA: pyridoxamine 5'-phosphate oxidase family protein [Microbacterium sp.]|uniref:pyridoxamine 5'-phosphate oxidase family protein n=1 Tax=Microbacterium sp. TaxID=51671 RepID=UPI002B46FB76|nr:pyridoxamine 5'-phosphate oxidase family protein [Microbacterium sp.]HKT57869.1 pyridoxamine 5'-phosphate oxidase family protein [Microbacterium sp.]